jgi:hypothetical protein
METTNRIQSNQGLNPTSCGVFWTAPYRMQTTILVQTLQTNDLDPMMLIRRLWREVGLFLHLTARQALVIVFYFPNDPPNRPILQ